MAQKASRPYRTSMEGMIWNANHILGYALRDNYRGVPKVFFEQSVGIAIMSVVDAGFIFSGSVGTGILTARRSDGSWSNPVACVLGGVGVGLLLGAQAKELLIFLADEESVQMLLSTGLKLGGKVGVTVGLGREIEGVYAFTKSGNAGGLTFAYTKGAFVGFSADGLVLTPRKRVNNSFYASNLEPADIINGDLTFPTDKVTMWLEVLEKLNKLCTEFSLEALEAEAEKEKEKLDEARVAADKAAEEIHSTEGEDVVEVNAADEAAKGD